MSESSSGFKISENGIADLLSGMKSRAQDLSPFLNRYAYPMLIKMQRQRWQTENDGQWKALKQETIARKSKKYASFPGSGTKMMIGTGQLVAAVTGDDTTFHRKIVQGNTLTIAITGESAGSGARAPRGKRRTLATNEVPRFSYAGFANAQRNFTEITPAAAQDIMQMLQKYLSSGDAA